jgi:hypothetical protein
VKNLAEFEVVEAAILVPKRPPSLPTTVPSVSFHSAANEISQQRTSRKHCEYQEQESGQTLSHEPS